MEINTGDINSASWQFTIELSRLWEQKHGEKNSIFAPRHVKRLSERFNNLENQECKFVIAPVKSIIDLPRPDMKIKIATALWKVYLAPVDIGRKGEEVSLNSHKTWLFQDFSVILPAFLKESHLGSSDQSVEINTNKNDNAVITPNNSEPIAKDRNNSVIDQFGGNIILVDENSLLNITSTHNEGILFIEMLGPASELLKTLGQDLKIVGLKDDFVKLLLEKNPLLDPFHLTQRKAKTVSITMALFVHESEDPEFIKKVIELLDKQISSIFPMPYIMNNLSLKDTKNLSSLFLHDASIKYFNIN
ncbi:hypothetical protein KKA14_16390 [bacterium]|nr:hypothetical protein [bacterium]